MLKKFYKRNHRAICKKIQELVNSNKYEKVAFTKFINSKDSIWYKKLKYKGCITEDNQAIMIDTKNNEVFEKLFTPR